MYETENMRGLKLVVGVYRLIFGMKLIAYLLTGVMALLAEALHTLSDIFVSGFLLLATLYSHKQADQTHMFGYRRAQNVAALVAAISFPSFELYKESIPHLFSAQTVEYQSLSLCPGTNKSDRKPSRWARKTMQKIRGEGGQQLTAAK